MRTLIFLFGTSLFLGFDSEAQLIPNGDFESWGIYNSWTEEPTGWNTPNSQLIETTVKDLDAYEGEFAMRVNPYNMGVGEYGWGNIDFPISYIPSSLDFYAKWDKTSTAAVGVDITFYNEDTPIYTTSWYAQENVSEWTLIQIPLDQIEPIMDHVTVNVYVSIGDFAPGEGWISVDQMSFGGVNGIHELTLNNDLLLFPNPVSDVLYIKDVSSSSSYDIYDQLGKKVANGVYGSGIDVKSLDSGSYTLSLITKKAVVRKGGFVIER
jgi:hypothetical protein